MTLGARSDLRPRRHARRSHLDGHSSAEVDSSVGPEQIGKLFRLRVQVPRAIQDRFVSRTLLPDTVGAVDNPKYYCLFLWLHNLFLSSIMSSLARTVVPLRAIGRSVASRPAATFHTSSVCQSLSEADHDSPDRASNIDRHKSDSIEKAKTGKGEWKPELASSSEQAISGDKHNMTIEQMQKLGEKKSEEGKNPSGSDSSKN
ncbi:uncharacterized protein A1O9_12276 [Exophiala aquamarina CBS 119918]|uniref:Uncharacterized protein n=1 Tax=Exophiala aquamarina CBS 119918 TaxID=1182545 RepID=A0A072NVL1_9EURO|nr:uncharacterized protein A1O9_12276 [Exophiala aquamarina CBS 119918]KEF51641.1 hypothetical protein A1O9_12276 [Exophiala aquamarina CBS 119918]